MSLELAAAHYDGLNNADCRPRLTDSNGNTYLLDSGSMTCVVPADATDTPDTSVRLKTVDGSPFTCYGRKELEIKINRKTYHITAVKANIKAPLLGWDFYKKYKLDMVWDEDKDEGFPPKYGYNIDK